MSNATTDIIIPVYGNYKLTKDCIESVLKYLDNTQRLILINDKSPEPKITAYLKKIKKENPKVILIEHATNLGFVRSVNEGMSLSKVNDVILLNSDTVVTKNWAQKMRQRAYEQKNIATVTPFSNSATLFSYPKYLEKNDLPDSLDPETINQYFEKATQRSIVSLPTGMGYCMYLKREAINMVGIFDEKTFGKGYGEENDFCMKAYYAGYINVGCPNTFIYHYDGGSFGNEKSERTKEAILKIAESHPHYHLWLKQFINNNPFLDLHRQVDLFRYTDTKKPALLLVLHNWGGGTEKHVKEIALSAVDKNWRTFIVTPFGGGIKLINGDPKESFELIFDGINWYQDLLKILKTLNIKLVHFHHLINVPGEMLGVSDDLGVKKDFTFHDFYTFCPRVHLVKTDKKFCFGTGNLEDCKECLLLKDLHNSWVEKNKKFLKSCRKLYVPSENTKSYLSKYLKLKNIKVIPHFEKNDFIKTEDDKCKIGGKIKVGIIGNASNHKGGKILKECVLYSQREGLPIEWYLFGYLSDIEIDNKLIHITGQYNGFNQLKSHLRRYPVDIVFLPSIWPETYSYILSESWFLKKPVLSADLGAISERVKNIGGGWLIPYPLSAKKVCGKIIYLKNNPEKINNVIKSINEKFKADKDFQWNEYYGGISEKTKEISKKDISEASKVLKNIANFQTDYQMIRDFESVKKWTGHLEKDIEVLNREIQRLRDNRFKILGSGIKNNVKKVIMKFAGTGESFKDKSYYEQIHSKDLLISKLQNNINKLKDEIRTLKKSSIQSNVIRDKKNEK